MNTEEYGLIVLCGSITLALRLVPMLAMRRLADAGLSDRLRRALAAIGPSALVSLLLLSLWPLLHALDNAPKSAATLIGLLVVALTHFWRRNLALSVLMGAIGYAGIFASVG